MRILMLAQSFAPILGGEERVVENLSLQLSARGHNVAIATLKQPGVEPENPGGDVRVHALRSSVSRLAAAAAERLYAPPLPDPETVVDLRRVLREERPDIVHAHNWIVHSYLPLDRRRGPALVMSLHDYGLVCPSKRLLRNGAPCDGAGAGERLRCGIDHYGAGRGSVTALGTLVGERTVRRHVDVFLPISSTVAELCRLGPGDTSRLTPNFIGDLPDPPGPDPRLEGLPAEPFILYFGDVTEDKGVAHLLAVHASLESPPPLVLIGRNYLGEATARPGVHTLGPLPYPLTIEALRRSMFSVAPSIWAEPFGMVALEAARAGKAIVASDIGGLRDIVVDRETGLLVAPGAAAPLRAALAELIADPPLRRRLGEAAARRAAEVFSPDALVPEVERSYRLALETRGHA